MKITIESYTEIYGAFDFADLYDRLFWEIPDNGIFIEVGCFAGKSTAYFAQQIKDTNRPMTFVVIDNFSEGPSNDYGVLSYQLETMTMEEVFKKNMTDLGLDSVVNINVGNSVDEAQKIPNNLLDGVFIDAAHDYNSVRADIDAWLPKIKETGFIAGHDIDFPGVWKAVRETFPQFKVLNRSWYVKLNESK